MFNLKWAVFPAGAAFLLAFLMSLIFGQVGLVIALLRAFIFAIMFFGIGCGAWVLINTYLPDLLLLEGKNASEDGVFPTDFSAESPTGSKVDITLGDSEEPASPAALPGDSYGIDGIGNISDLVSKAMNPAEQPGDIDQAPSNNYNSELGDMDFATMSDVPGGLANSDDTSTADSGGLGDFSSFFDGLTAKGAMGESEDSLSDLFQTLSTVSAPASSEELAKVERKTGERNSVEMKGDFSPKEIAAGIRTVLANEKKRG